MYEDFAGHYRHRLNDLTVTKPSEDGNNAAHHQRLSRNSRNYSGSRGKQQSVYATRVGSTTKLFDDWNTNSTCAKPAHLTEFESAGITKAPRPAEEIPENECPRVLN